MINVDYRRLDECRLIHQHPQTYYHQSRESLGKPAPVSKLAFFLFFNFFSSRKTQKPEKAVETPGASREPHTSPLASRNCLLWAFDSPGAGEGDADVTCSVERSIWQNGEPAGGGRLGDGQKQIEFKKKKKCICTWNSAVGLGSSEGGGVAEVPPRGCGSFLGACTRAVPPALGLLPLPNCDQMRVK